VLQGDLFSPLAPGLRFDLVVANVPYVPSGEITHLPVEMREHEDAGTLDGGLDGLDVLRRVLLEVGAWLTPRGRMFVELDEAQTGPAEQCARSLGLAAEVHAQAPSDEWDDPTHVLGIRQSAGNIPATA
jgi:release factor glutamine methyltransferase